MGLQLSRELIDEGAVVAVNGWAFDVRVQAIELVFLDHCHELCGKRRTVILSKKAGIALLKHGIGRGGTSADGQQHFDAMLFGLGNQDRIKDAVDMLRARRPAGPEAATRHMAAIL